MAEPASNVGGLVILVVAVMMGLIGQQLAGAYESARSKALENTVNNQLQYAVNERNEFESKINSLNHQLSQAQSIANTQQEAFDALEAKLKNTSQATDAGRAAAITAVMPWIIAIVLIGLQLQTWWANLPEPVLTDTAPNLSYDMVLKLPIKRRSDMRFEDPVARRGR